MTRLALGVAILAFIALTPAGRLQAQNSGPAFDVASVKPSTGGRLSITRAPSRLTVLGAPLSSLILMAYNVRASLARFTFEGLTNNAVLSARFDVTATVSAGTTASNEEQMLMLRRLLAERFRLKTRAEMRDIPVYALTVAQPGRLGAQLRPSADNCEIQKTAVCQSAAVAPGQTTLRSAGGITALLRQIEGQLDRPAIDRTELTGNFEWQLTYQPSAARDRDPLGTQKAPEIAAALQEQLGLRLVPIVAPYEIMTIESVEMPTPD